MSQPSNRDAENRAFLGVVLDRVQGQLKAVAAAAWGMLLLACLFGYLLGFVLLDHGIDGGVPLTIRRSIWVVVAAVLGGAAIMFWLWPLVRQISDLYTARVIERAHPELRNALITALQLRPAEVHAGISAGVHEHAAVQLERCNLSRSVSRRPWQRNALTAGLIVLLIGVYSLFAPKAVGPSLLRAFGADIPAPTRTTVRVVSPAEDASVIIGTPVEFEIELGGYVPAEAFVEFAEDSAGTSWQAGQQISLHAAADDTAAGHTGRRWRGLKIGRDVSASTWYRVRAGDGVTPMRRLEVRPQPQVGEPAIDLHFPSFSGRSDEHRDSGHLDVIAGTRITLSAETNVSASTARLVFHDAHGPTARQMTIEPATGRTLRAEWIAERDAEYEIRFSDRYGAENASPIRYRLRVREDGSPVISQSDPKRRKSVAPDGVIRFRADITDDCGLVDAAIVYQTNGGAGRIAIVDAGDSAPTSISVERTVRVSEFHAAPGEVIRLHIEAHDNHRDLQGRISPQEGRGPVCEMTVEAKKNPHEPNKAGSGRSGGDDPSTSGHSGAHGDSGHDGLNGDGPEKGDGANDGSDTDGKTGPAGDSPDSDKGENRSTRTRKSDGNEQNPPRQDAEDSESGHSRDSESHQPGSAKASSESRGDWKGQSPEAGKADSDARKSGDDLDRFVRENHEKLEKLRRAAEESSGESGDKSQGKDEKPARDAESGEEARDKSRDHGGDRADEKNKKDAEHMSEGDASKDKNASDEGPADSKNSGHDKDEKRDQPGQSRDVKKNAPPSERSAEEKPSDSGSTADPKNPADREKPIDGGEKPGRGSDQIKPPSQTESGDGEEQHQSDGNKNDGAKEPGRGAEKAKSDQDKPNGPKSGEKGDSQPQRDSAEGNQPRKTGEKASQGAKRDKVGQDHPPELKKKESDAGQKKPPSGEKKDDSKPQDAEQPKGPESKSTQKGEGGRDPGEKDSDARRDSEEAEESGDSSSHSDGEPQNSSGKTDSQGKGKGQGEEQGQDQGESSSGKPSNPTGQQGKNSAKGQASDKPGENKGPPQDDEKKGDGKPTRDNPGSGESKTGAEQGDPSREPGRAPAERPGPLRNKGARSGPVVETDEPVNADGHFKGEGDGSKGGLSGQDIENARRAVDELERRLRKSDDSGLKDLGWGRAEAQRFVSEFHRREARAQADASRKFSGQVGESEGAGDAGAVRREGTGHSREMESGVSTDQRTGRAEQLHEDQPERVPPEYNDLLREYYRSMGRRTSGS